MRCMTLCARDFYRPGRRPNRQRARRLLSIPAMIFATASPAYAACPNAAASCNQVCQPVAGHVWECELKRNGNTAPDANITIVYQWSGGSLDYQAWGKEGYLPYGTATGRDFCCEIDGVEASYPYNVINKIVALGTDDENDPMAFTYDDGTEYNLSNHGGTGYLEGEMDGRVGDDHLYGSNETAADYAELLKGMGDDDEIECGDGNDEADGGDGADIVRGQEGLDVVWGGNDPDIAVCGGPGEGDEVHSGPGNDLQVWDSNTGDIVDGGPGNDTCGQNGGSPTFVVCEAWLGAQPAECPEG